MLRLQSILEKGGEENKDSYEKRDNDRIGYEDDNNGKNHAKVGKSHANNVKSRSHEGKAYEKDKNNTNATENDNKWDDENYNDNVDDVRENVVNKDYVLVMVLNNYVV